MSSLGGLGDEVPLDSTDGVSSLSFAPLAPLLLATSWDGVRVPPTSSSFAATDPNRALRRRRCGGYVVQGVRVYDVGTNRSLRSQFRQEGPVLCGTFVESGSAMLAGGLDTNLVRWVLRSSYRHPTQSVCGPHSPLCIATTPQQLQVRFNDGDRDHGGEA
jgi:hypothetical protein